MATLCNSSLWVHGIYISIHSLLSVFRNELFCTYKTVEGAITLPLGLLVWKDNQPFERGDLLKIIVSPLGNTIRGRYGDCTMSLSQGQKQLAIFSLSPTLQIIESCHEAVILVDQEGSLVLGQTKPAFYETLATQPAQQWVFFWLLFQMSHPCCTSEP